jgi:ribosome modulation factor
MRHAAGTALLILGALLLAGCASVPVQKPAEVCPAADWRAYGRNDGLLGVPAEERARLFAECRNLGHPPDAAAYEAGRAEGLREYCTLENGYEVGYAGRRYRDVCPPELETGFLQGYEEGRDDRRRTLRAYPRFGFGIGIGSFHDDGHWWLGHRYPWYW